MRLAMRGCRVEPVNPVANHKLIRMGGMGETPLCVVCRKDPVANRWRPFCGERCRNEDLARWADGRYRVAGDPTPAPDNEADTNS